MNIGSRVDEGHAAIHDSCRSIGVRSGEPRTRGIITLAISLSILSCMKAPNGAPGKSFVVSWGKLLNIRENFSTPEQRDLSCTRLNIAFRAELRHLGEIDEIGGAHRLSNPIGDWPGGEADIVQRLIGAVLMADDGRDLP
ncbi:UNVERIFIED_ORG: hypothetical protein GGE53_004000 [Rhizobium etli]